MTILSWKRGVVAFGLIAAAGAQAADNPLFSPSWKDQRIARVNFSTAGDQRKGQDMIDFRLNEAGSIDGQELLGLIHLGSFAMFEGVLKAHPELSSELNPKKKPIKELYNDFLQENVDRSMAILVLNRILDHEAMKMKIPPNVSEDRVNYVMRSILTQASAESGKIRVREVPSMTRDTCDSKSRCFSGKDPKASCRPHPLVDAQGKAVTEKHPAEDLSNLSNEQLYPWLQAMVGKAPVNFHIDWQYNEGGLASDLRDLTSSRKELPWPEASLPFERLPESWQEFREMIRAKLQPSYRTLLRTMVWQKLSGERTPFLKLQAAAQATPEQKAAYYAAMRDAQLKIEHLKSEITEVRVEGEKAADFTKRFNEVLSLRDHQYDSELKTVVNGPSDPKEDERMMNRSAQLRATVPAEVYRSVVLEFASDIAARRLRVSIGDSTLAYDSSEPMPNGSCFEDKEMQEAFDKDFLTSGFFPTMVGVAQDQSIRIMIPKKLQELPATFISASDPRVAKAINQNILSKVNGVAFRKLSFDLFSRNRVEYLSSTCSQPEWPCATSNPQRLAEMLFPEQTFADANGRTIALPVDGPGQGPLASTMGRESEVRGTDRDGLPRKLIDYVMAISMEGLSKALDQSNDHMDLRGRY